MNKKIKESFDLIHAEDEIKNSTKDFLMRKMTAHNFAGSTAVHNYACSTAAKKTASSFRRKHLSIPAGICIAVLMFTLIAVPVYFTPASVISIDINPSIELNLNCFDRVIFVKSYNDDGLVLKESLNLRFMNYQDAVDKILNSGKITELLAADEVISIVVIDSNEKQCEKILSGVSSCAENHSNTFCHSADKGDVSQAHELDMSYGKYCAFLELKELDDNITPEEVKAMTMREIRNMIKELSTDSYNTPPEESTTIHDDEHIEDEHHNGNGSHHGNGNGMHHGSN